MTKKCPQCGSYNVVEYEDDITFLVCKSCGYDELQQGTVSGERTSQREKARFSPYKVGGKERTRK